MGSDEEIENFFVHELAKLAGWLTEKCAGRRVLYNPDQLEICLQQALIDAHEDIRCRSDALYMRFVAAHAACRLVRHTDAIFADGAPQIAVSSTAERIPLSMRRRGASNFVTGWACEVAQSILRNFGGDSVPEGEGPTSSTLRIVDERKFMSILGDLDSERTHDMHDRIVPGLVRCIQDTATAAATENELKALLPESRPPRRQRRTPSSTTVVASIVCLIAGLGAGAFWRATDAAPPIANVTNPEQPKEPELAFRAPTLNHVSLRLYAYPADANRDPDVFAEPEAPTRARAAIHTGVELIVEIELANRLNITPDPTEHFKIGLKPSGRLTRLPQPTATESVPDGPPHDPLKTDLAPAPTTDVKPLDAGGRPTIFTMRLKAEAQPGAKDTDGGYFCGFNTEYVSAILQSDKHPNADISTALPVLVLRDNC